MKTIEDILISANRSDEGDTKAIKFIDKLIKKYGMSIEISKKGMVFHSSLNKEYNCIIRFMGTTSGYLLKNITIDIILSKIASIIIERLPSFEDENIVFCNRCGGSGKLKHYQHIDGGTCFKCKGQGFSIVDNMLIV